MPPLLIVIGIFPIFRRLSKTRGSGPLSLFSYTSIVVPNLIADVLLMVIVVLLYTCTVFSF